MTGKRVLVDDDDRLMVETLCDILALHGWTPIAAFDGAEAIVRSREASVDVVLMDVRMPRVDGVTTLRAIRDEQPDARVVMITVFAASDLLAQARDGGARRILAKPVNVPDLLDALAEAVR